MTTPTMQTLYHNRVQVQEEPKFDAWMQPTIRDADMQRFYSQHLEPYGSFANMFFQDAVEPGNEYRRRGGGRDNIQPKPLNPWLRLPGQTPLALAPGYNPLVTDSVNAWGRRLQQNTNNSMSMFSTLDDAYWENPWDNYQVAKPFMDWTVYENHIAHADDVARLWFR